MISPRAESRVARIRLNCASSFCRNSCFLGFRPLGSQPCAFRVGLGLLILRHCWFLG